MKKRGDKAMDMNAVLIGCQMFRVRLITTGEHERHSYPTYQGTLTDVKTLLINHQQAKTGG